MHADADRRPDHARHLTLIQPPVERLAAARPLAPAETDAAVDVIAAAYTASHPAMTPETIIQQSAWAGMLRTVVKHAVAHGTVLRPTAPRLHHLAAAVWLPAEAPPLPPLDRDLLAACGPYTELLFSYDAMLRARYGGERYDVLWHAAVHPSMRRRGIARMLLHHRHRVLASQGRRTFALAPSVPARDLLTSVGFRTHLPTVDPAPSTPLFPMLCGPRLFHTDLLNPANGTVRRGQP